MVCFSVIHAELNKKSSSYCNCSALPSCSMNDNGMESLQLEGLTIKSMASRCVLV